MKIKTIHAFFALLILVAGCSTVRVTSEHDEAYSFASTKTYQWVEGPQGGLGDFRIPDKFFDPIIRNAADDELKKKGLSPVAENSAPDLHVSYFLKLEERLDIDVPRPDEDTQFSGGFVYKQGRGWSYEEREPDIIYYGYDKGILTVVIFDAKTGDRVWRGILKTKVYRSRPAEEKEEKIRAAVEKLLARYPAK
ncbi:MAG: DUF4136 domain-containing protein [Kiritimatiellales bacterium]|nr:DUF4136 domain-containing protein [Kiritimatiellales bacterium]